MEWNGMELPQMQRGNSFRGVCLSILFGSNFQMILPTNFIFGTPAHLHGV